MSDADKWIYWKGEAADAKRVCAEQGARIEQLEGALRRIHGLLDGPRSDATQWECLVIVRAALTKMGKERSGMSELPLPEFSARLQMLINRDPHFEPFNAEFLASEIRWFAADNVRAALARAAVAKAESFK